MNRNDKILQYLEPKRQAILEEEGVDVLDGKTKDILDCKVVFMNAALQCSEANEEDFKVIQKDLAFYLNITDSQVHYYLERHLARYKESAEFRDLSDKWKEKFCGFDSCNPKETYREALGFAINNASERLCKKILSMAIECDYIDKETVLNKEELKVGQNE